MKQAWIEKLVELQDLDLKMSSIQKLLDDLPQKQAEVRKRLQQQADDLEAASQSLKQAECTVKKMEAEAETLRNRKRDFQAKTALIKNNDEYHAALQQISQCEQSISDMETKQLECLMSIDGLKQACIDKKERADSARKQAAALLEELENKAANYRTQLDTLSKERPAIMAEVKAIEEQEREAGLEPAPYLASYERIRGNKPVTRFHLCLAPLNDQACGCCKLQVTLQLMAMAKKGKLAFCPSCGTIIYQE